jgi:wyosine [tRNA(Phe)-imidazoG37] synthetase (radical SAM superfamily)
MRRYRYLFGPVPSRRFGRSLGVDLVPLKTCSLDCVFCQLGKTTRQTTRREAYVPIDQVLAELDDWLSTGGKADIITLSGSGEPTLHTAFGEVLAFLKRAGRRSALLTNGTLLGRPEVAREAIRADIVKISLSAWDQQSYEWINRPCRSLTFEDLTAGYRAFRRSYSGQLWMEVFLLQGMNAGAADVVKIAAAADAVAPDRIQLNTVTRPPAEDFAAPVPADRLQACCKHFYPPAEPIGEGRRQLPHRMQVSEGAILAMLQRRPCTSEQIAGTYRLHISEVSKYLGRLMTRKCIRPVRQHNRVYYVADRGQRPAPETAPRRDGRAAGGYRNERRPPRHLPVD